MRIIKGDEGKFWADTKSEASQQKKLGARIITRESFNEKKFAEKLKQEAHAILSCRENSARIHAKDITKEVARQTKLDLMDKRAERAIEFFFLLEEYALCAKKHVQDLALFIVNKILGGPLQMPNSLQIEMISEGVNESLTPNRMVVECPIGRRDELHALIDKHPLKPSISVIENLEIQTGFLRLNTVFGEIQCREIVMFAALNESVYEQ